MADRLTFHLVSPERELFAGEVDQVIVPGEQGDFGVLAAHAPFMSTIRAGAIIVTDAGETRRIFVDGGFAEVTPEGLTILAEFAVPLDDVDADRLAQDLQDAREDVADATDPAKKAEAEERFARLEAIDAAKRSTVYV